MIAWKAGWTNRGCVWCGERDLDGSDYCSTGCRVADDNWKAAQEEKRRGAARLPLWERLTVSFMERGCYACAVFALTFIPFVVAGAFMNRPNCALALLVGAFGAAVVAHTVAVSGRARR